MKQTRDALIVFLLLAFTYGYFHQDPGWNGHSRLALIFAAVREGRLTIDSFHEQPEMETGDKSLFNGHYYSDKAIGTALVGVLVYAPIHALMRLTGAALPLWVEKYLLTFLVIGLPSAFAGSLMYLICASVAATRARAYVATAAVTLGTMSFPFSVVFFGHQLAAALLFIAFYLVFRLKTAPSAGKGRLFLLGLLLGLSMITEMTTAVIVLLLVAYYFHTLWLRRDTLFDGSGGREEVATRKSTSVVRRRVAAFVLLPALGGLLPLLAMLVYNYLCFGSPFSLAYSHLENPVFREGMSRGLMGIGWPRPEVLFFLTFHPAMGIFWQSPVLLASLVGLWFMYRDGKYKPEALVAVAALAAFLLINAGYYMWWGGWSFGPRHLIPALPFLALPLLFVPARAFLLVVLLTLVSVFQMFVVAGTVIGVPSYLLLDHLSSQARRLLNLFVGLATGVQTESFLDVGLDFFRYTTIYGFCLRNLIAGEFGWNIGRLCGLPGWVSMLLIVLVNAFGAAHFCLPHAFARFRPPKQSSQQDGPAT